MKLLFLTTYNVTIECEHVFTINVWNELCKQFDSRNDEISLATIVVDALYTESTITEEACNGKKYYKLHYSPSLSYEEKVEEIARFYNHIAPDVIHSNMVEVIDVEAAKRCDIPIVLTIHIGGFICPRSGGNGFLKFDNSICDTKVNNSCFKCCAQDFPLPPLARFLYWIIPSRLREWAYYKLKNKQIFYLTQFLGKSHEIILRQKAVETYKYATVIAANRRLQELLAMNGLTDNVLQLSHGVKPRPKLLFPQVNDVVKFYYLGRIDFGKGLHNLLKAFNGVDDSLYELHFIGGGGRSRRDRRYYESITKYSVRKNIVFHGRMPNTEIESVIKDMHVMIHPGIVHEVYGLTIAESLSLGRPVLSTRCGGSEMQIQDGVNGWLVESNNITALSEKIKEIISHKDELESMSRNCHLPHSLSEYCVSLYDLYQEKVR